MNDVTTVERPRGIDRTEPWLSLDDDEQQTRRLIGRLAHETWESVLVGDQAPIVAARFNRMSHPQVGDLVVEASRTWSPRATVDDICKGVGYLVAKRLEREEMIWYIQYGPAARDVCKWSNADFYAIDLGSLR